MGGWYNNADVRRDGHYTCKGMGYAKMFYGGMVLFSVGGGIPRQLEYWLLGLLKQ